MHIAHKTLHTPHWRVFGILSRLPENYLIHIVHSAHWMLNTAHYLWHTCNAHYLWHHVCTMYIHKMLNSVAGRDSIEPHIIESWELARCTVHSAQWNIWEISMQPVWHSGEKSNPHNIKSWELGPAISVAEKCQWFRQSFLFVLLWSILVDNEGLPHILTDEHRALNTLSGVQR